MLNYKTEILILICLAQLTIGTPTNWLKFSDLVSGMILIEYNNNAKRWRPVSENFPENR